MKKVMVLASAMLFALSVTVLDAQVHKPGAKKAKADTTKVAKAKKGTKAVKGTKVVKGTKAVKGAKATPATKKAAPKTK